jgi:hypothetical protein
MAFTKITQAELESRGATTLPNQPTISASLLKQEFDAPAKEIVAPAFNNLIDELEADTAADSLGVSMPEGRTGDPTIQGAIDSISEDLGTAEGKVTELEGLKHSHSNKATIDKFSEASDNLYWNGSPVGGGGGTSDYVDLENKPQINNVTLIGNMSAHDLGLATESALANKVDKETGKGLSSNDYTDGEKADVAKIDTIEGNVGTLTSSVGIVQGKVTTLEGQMYSVQDDLDDKVDKVEGQGLSTNDYTNADKAKVNALGTASTKNSTSVVTDSTDLVESGAVKDIVGWGNKNVLPYQTEIKTGSGSLTVTPSNNRYSFTGTAGGANAIRYPVTVPINSGVYRFIADGYEHVEGSNINLYYDDNGTTRALEPNGTIDLSEYTITTIAFFAGQGVTPNYQNIGLMLVKESEPDKSFEPYHASVEEMFESLGGTLDCNQLIQNGNFDSTSGWSTYRSTLSVSNNIAQLVYAESGTDYVLIRNLNCKANHKYLVMSDIKPVANARMDYYLLKNNYSYSETSIIKNISSGVWNRCEAIISISQDTNVLWLSIKLDSSNTSTEVKNYNLIDLTQLFGSTIADYIYSLEQATAGAGIAYFRKYFPNDYYEYSEDDGILNTLDSAKADNTVIGTVENGTNPTKAYAVNEFMVRDGAFCQVTAPVTTSSTWAEGSNYTKKSIAEVLQSLMS